MSSRPQKGYDWSNDSHPERCTCGYKRKPNERFQKLVGRWMCKDCERNLKKGIRR